MKNFVLSVILASFSVTAFGHARSQSRQSHGPALGGRGDSFAVKQRHAVGPALGGRGSTFAVKQRHAVGPEVTIDFARQQRHDVGASTNGNRLDLNQGF